MIKKIVTISGGSGSAMLINSLKHFSRENEVSAVVGMSDSGTSSGVLRKHFKSLPPADILRAILSFSPYPYEILLKVFRSNRFTHLKNIPLDNSGTGHNVGNLFLTLLAREEGNFMSAIKALEIAVEAQGHVYPATLMLADLCVELDDGTIVKEEGKIDRPNYDRSKRIVRAWLEPEAPVYSEAAKKIREADYILFNTGSLYTSVISALLPKGMKEAIAASKAKLIYVASNGREANGETGPAKLSEYVKELEAYLPRQLDAILYSDCKLNKKQQKKYVDKNWELYNKDAKMINGRWVVGCNFESSEGGWDGKKLGKILGKVIK